RGDGFDAVADVHDFGDRPGGVFCSDTACGLADVDEFVFAAVDEGAKEDSTDEGEDRRVGSNAEGQGEDDGDRKSFGAEERAEGELQVVEEGHGNLLGE